MSQPSDREPPSDTPALGIGPSNSLGPKDPLSASPIVPSQACGASSPAASGHHDRPPESQQDSQLGIHFESRFEKEPARDMSKIELPATETRRSRSRRHGPSHIAKQPPSVAAMIMGVVGELLITAGVLVGLFLVWQLWWTDIVGDKQQAAIIENLSWANTLPSDGKGQQPIVKPGTGEPPVPGQPSAEGDTFAVMYIPALGKDYERPISEGTSLPNVLNTKGLGHYENTAMPGGVGNFAIAGHRSTYGKPLNRIAELKVGDALVVRTKDTWYVYKMTDSLIVKPNQVEVIAPQPGKPGATPTNRYITLTACHPMFSAEERYIVHGELQYWAPVDGNAIPAEMAEGK